MAAPNYKGILKQILNQKSMTTITPRLPVGKNRATLTYYGVRTSQQGKGTIFTAEFDCNGEKRCWEWVPEASGFRGEYERDRANQFLITVAKSIGDKRSVEEIADSLLAPEQHGRGLVIDVIVTNKFEKDGSPVMTAKGEQITDVAWVAVPQTLGDIAAQRAKLDGTAAPQASAAGPSVLAGLGA